VHLWVERDFLGTKKMLIIKEKLINWISSKFETSIFQHIFKTHLCKNKKAS
jgi:hypothetical protein